MMQFLINYDWELIINILLFTLAISSSLLLIIFKNPIYKILMFLCTLIIIGITWIILNAEFLSILAILLYIASSMVLFLFTIMMVDVKIHYKPFVNQLSIKSISSIIISLLFTCVFIFISKDYIYLVKSTELKNIFPEIINSLSTEFLLFFALISLILLLPMIAVNCIDIANHAKINKFLNTCNRKLRLLDLA